MDDIDFQNYIKETIENERILRKYEKVLIIGGRSMRNLSEKISNILNVEYCDTLIEDFPNSEIKIELKSSLRNRNIFIFQTGVKYQGLSINDYLIELLMLIDACKRSSAKRINIIFPFYAYSRSDKKDKSSVPIGAKAIANILQSQNIDRLITIDLHSGQVQGFGDFPFDNLYGINTFLNYFEENLFKNFNEDKYLRVLPEEFEDNDKIINELKIDYLNENYVLVSPDAGGIKRIEDYSERLKLNYVIVHKKRNPRTNEIIKTILIGERNEVEDKTAIVIDDMIDTAGTCISNLHILEENGVEDVILVCTHAILSGSAIDRINDCDLISKVLVLDTLPQDKNQERCDKLEVLGLENFMSNIIKNIIEDKSLTKYFH